MLFVGKILFIVIVACLLNIWYVEYFWVSTKLTLLIIGFFSNRFVSNRKNEKLKVSSQVSDTKTWKPDSQSYVWSAEATPVHTLL